MFYPPILLLFLTHSFTHSIVSASTNLFADNSFIKQHASSDCSAAIQTVASSSSNDFNAAFRWGALFFSNAKDVCSVVEEVISASTLISNSCSQKSSSTGGFQQNDIYKIWANPAAAHAACTLVPVGSGGGRQTSSPRRCIEVVSQSQITKDKDSLCNDCQRQFWNAVGLDSLQMAPQLYFLTILDPHTMINSIKSTW